MTRKLLLLATYAEEHAMLSRSYRRDAGQLIKRLRKNKKLSLRAFAAEVNISCSMLCLIENEKQLPSLKLLIDIMEWLRKQKGKER